MDSQNKCKKCGESSVVVTDVKELLCKDCFLSYCTHKFRSTIGKSKMVKPGETVLIAFSGGRCSSALVHMVSKGLSADARKRFHFIPKILYINDTFVLDGDCSSVRPTSILKSCGVDAYAVSLESAYKNGDLSIHNIGNAEHVTVQDPVLAEKLKEAVNDISSLTSKQEFLKRLKLRVIAAVAKELKCDKVLVGDSQSRLAATLFTAVAQGQGASLALETGFCDTRYDIPLLRPLREFTLKEIVLYNFHSEIEYTAPRNILGTENLTSIFNYTSDFITNLQSDFPATTSTIFRTGEKLSNVIEDNVVICRLCNSSFQADSNSDLASAFASLQLSLSFSKHNKQKNDLRENISRTLCYSCCHILEDMSNPELLPPNILQNA